MTSSYSDVYAQRYEDHRHRSFSLFDVILWRFYVHTKGGEITYPFNHFSRVTLSIFWTNLLRYPNNL
jgi:hypothetical protein